MAFTPAWTNWGGLLPVMEAARSIIESDMAGALTWRSGLDGSTAGSTYARIQHTQRHSSQYPLLVIQPATDTPAPLGTGGARQAHVFDVEIYLTKSIATSTPGDAHDDLVKELIRYYDATVHAFMSATDAQWTAHYPDDSEAKNGRIEVWCTNAVFGQLEKAKEIAGLYLHSVAFELQVRLTEAMR